MDNNHPVTRVELDQILDKRFDQFRAELKTDLAQQKQEIAEDLTGVMRNIETSLLTAFHGYAQSNSARLNLVDITDRELRIRMDALEMRVLNIETRRPPAA
jgi:BMFP domain-containing protein YqiC